MLGRALQAIQRNRARLRRTLLEVTAGVAVVSVAMVLPGMSPLRARTAAPPPQTAAQGGSVAAAAGAVTPEARGGVDPVGLFFSKTH